MKQEFYDRKVELALLLDKYAKLTKGELVVIYGRRRVGKTELIRKFLDTLETKQLYFYVDVLEKPQLLESLSHEMQSQLGESIRFADWGDFFDYLDVKAAKSKFVLVLDEFQRFLDVSPDFLTRLQRYWDEKLKHSNLMIFLVGSSMGMAQKIVESKAGPLYGRVTCRLKIKPFRYLDFREMFQQLNEEQKIIFYSVFGGTPQYCLLAQHYGKDVFSAISEHILSKGGELEDEPERFLEYERFRAHAKYNAILQALASGKGNLKELTDFTKIPPTTLPAYLIRLESLLDIIEKKDPLSGKERLGRYIIKDPFFAFWYRFVFPNKTQLNLGNNQQVLSFIKQNLNIHTAGIFEEIIKELLQHYNGKKIQNQDIQFDALGTWWDSFAHEIDIVAQNSKNKTLIVCEVKWTNEKMDIDVLDALSEKVKYLNFNGHYTVMLVSKSGFTARCLDKIKFLNGIALDLQDISALFNGL